MALQKPCCLFFFLADYHRCTKILAEKGQDVKMCEWYHRVYKSLCPISWVSGSIKLYTSEKQHSFLLTMPRRSQAIWSWQLLLSLFPWDLDFFSCYGFTLELLTKCEPLRKTVKSQWKNWPLQKSKYRKLQVDAKRHYWPPAKENC